MKSAHHEKLVEPKRNQRRLGGLGCHCGILGIDVGESGLFVSEMDEWVAFYEANGLTYFPLFGITNGACRCKNGATCGANAGKHPRVTKWKGQPSQRPTDLDNVGVSTDPLVVLDFDGDVGLDALADYPPTFTTSTGHGFHLWYKADPDKKIGNRVGWKHKVDIRAFGGMVVAPPSRHRSGSEYRHVAGDSIQPIPQDILNSIPEHTTRVPKIGHPVSVGMEITNPLMQPLARKLVETMEAATENRNQTLFILACRYFELAHANMLGADVLADLFTAAINSGLTVQEIERTIHSANNSV